MRVLLGLLAAAVLLWALDDGAPDTDAAPALAPVAAPALLPARDAPSLQAPRQPAPPAAAADPASRLPAAALPPVATHAYVRALDGSAIENAWVTWLRYDPTIRPAPRRNVRRGGCRSNWTGCFEIPKPAAGKSVAGLRIRKQGYYPHEGPFTPAADGTPPVYALRPLPVLEGRVYDADGEPAGFLDVYVRTLRPDGEIDKFVAKTHTSSSAAWRFVLPAGRYLVSIEGGVNAITERELELVDGPPTRWDVALARGTFLRAQLALPPALRAERVEVELYEADAQGALDVEHGQLGNEWTRPGARALRFQVPAKDRPYWLVVRSDGLRDLPLHVAGPFRGPAALETLEVPEGAARLGTLRGHTWIPQASDDDEPTTCTVELRDAHGFEVHTEVRGGRDVFGFARVPLGTYELRITNDGERVLIRKQVTLAAETLLDLGELVAR